MADYYPLIARAVGGLDKNTGENRRALYERARLALVTQLRKEDPRLSEFDITRERLALEESIRKVEAEASKRPVERDPLAELARLIGENTPLGDFISAPKTVEQSADPDRGRKLVRLKLAEVASPAPALSIDGKLDAGPNVIYDAPSNNEDDLASLPIQQRALIKTILSGLPRNAPPQLRTSLESYDEHLRDRGAQPILGLLKDMAEIIRADVGAPAAAREWLAEGLQKAFELFDKNQKKFVDHFPLDPKREELYSGTPVDEDAAIGKAVSQPFDDVAKATDQANKSGLTTDDFVKIVGSLAEYAKIISTLPPAAPFLQRDQITDGKPVSAKKRMLLTGIGFFERVYNLMGSSATLATPESGAALLNVLQKAIATLSKFVGF